jgi:hypothetical protein
MLSGPGCASVSLLNLKAEKIPTADPGHPAIEVLAIWQAAEGPGVKGIPTRGFQGQIFFFTQDRATPVAVDGTARIYVFDDHGTPQEQTRPLHQFDFDRESWKAHLQLPKIGPTYGVFIPDPRNDFHQAVCSLRVRFTPLKGRPLYSSSSTIVLPGPPVKAENEMAQRSPFSALEKKLQEDSRAGRLSLDLAAAQSPPSFGANPQSATAQAQSFETQGTLATQAPQAARNGLITQVSAAATAPADGGPLTTTVQNAAGISDVRQQDAIQPSARVKLQPTTGTWSSRSDETSTGDDDSAGPPAP